MASDRQIAANRKNALRSTGPVTQAGKAASRGNALRHGLTSQILLLIEGEDPELLSELRQALIARFAPQDALEMSFVEALTGTVWRLRRAVGFEAVLIEWKKIECKKNDDSMDFLRNNMFALAEDDEADHTDDKTKALARALIAALTNGNLLGNLSRHEAHLARHAEHLFDRLGKLKAERSAAAV